MSAIQNFLNNGRLKMGPALPAMHTSFVSSFKNIIDEGQLSVSSCNVFQNEQLLYFFYGKPAYKKSGVLQGCKDWQLPVCFLVNSDKIDNIKRIYPFDSGAFIGKRHPEYITSFDVEDFNIGEDIALSRMLIGSFFDKVEDLYSLNPRSERTLIDEYGLSEDNFQVKALRDLASDTSLTDIDDRRFCIEIQSSSNIQLAADVVDAVVIPTFLAEDESLRMFIEEELEAEIVVYRKLSGTSKDHTFIIYDRVMEYLYKKGIV